MGLKYYNEILQWISSINKNTECSETILIFNKIKSNMKKYEIQD